MAGHSIRQKLKLLRDAYSFFKLFLEANNPDVEEFLRELELFRNDGSFKKIGLTESELISLMRVSAQLAKIPKYRRYDRLWMILSSEVISLRLGNTIFSIEPLSRSTIRESIKLVKRILPEQGLENVSIAFNASLAFEESGIKTLFYRFLLNSYGINELHYWVVIHEKSQSVVGTTGLYCHSKDTHEADWVGWMCVHPDFRGHGIGSKLVNFSITKAKERGKKYLRLYTSDDPNEAAANRIYEREGFRIFKKVPKKRYTILYRQKEL